MIYLIRNTLMFCIYCSIIILGYLFACHINGFRNVNADLYFDALNNYLLKKMYHISLLFYQEILMVQCIFRKDIKASKTF